MRLLAGVAPGPQREWVLLPVGVDAACQLHSFAFKQAGFPGAQRDICIGRNTQIKHQAASLGLG